MPRVLGRGVLKEQALARPDFQLDRVVVAEDLGPGERTFDAGQVQGVSGRVGLRAGLGIVAGDVFQAFAFSAGLASLVGKGTPMIRPW